MLYQAVILSGWPWHIMLRQGFFSGSHRGNPSPGQRKWLILRAGCCLFARAHRVAISPNGCLTLFFY